MLQTETMAKHPPDYPHLEEICANCQSYGFKPGNPEPGQAYCGHFKKWFPKQFDMETLAPGLRTCKHWGRKTEFNEDA